MNKANLSTPARWGVGRRHPVLAWALAPLPRFVVRSGDERSLCPQDLQAPSPAGGHLGALGESSRARTSRGRRQPGRRSRHARSSRLADLASTFRKPPGSETFCVSCFFSGGERGLRASRERRGLRRGHRRALQHVGAGPARALGPAAAGRAGGEGQGLVFYPLLPFPLQIPRSSKLHHSGNDDSVRIIQAPASLSSPSPPYLFGAFTIA